MGDTSFYTEIGRNRRDSFLLVLFIILFVVAIAFIFSGIFLPELSLIIILVVGIFMVIDATVSYRYGDQVVLKSTNARPADKEREPYLVNTVEGLALAAGLPVPDVYVIPGKEINAFATGRDPKHASVAVTEGALEKLNRQELEGVIAHEMSHIGNYDIRFFMVVAVFVGLVAILSHILLRSMWYSGGGGNRKGEGTAYLYVIGIVLAIVAPIAVRLTQLAISRKREYLADATGAKLTRYPPGLAGALKKIKQYNQGNMNVSEAVSHLFISDPKATFMDNIFATHPPIDERVRRLEGM
jgi:heat shock protein HtpX